MLFIIAQGSIHPYEALRNIYQNKDEKPIVLVGKGLTYDSGGYAINLLQEWLL